MLPALLEFSISKFSLVIFSPKSAAAVPQGTELLELTIAISGSHKKKSKLRKARI